MNAPRTVGIAIAILALTAAREAHAQPASFGQYLLVLDDSGSMEESDPRRLVEMAALAFAGALEDGDQVMIAGLGELAAGGVPARFQSPRELLAGRDGPEGVSPIGEARLEHHEGQTPCAAGLAEARRLLNAMSSSGAPQTLLLLTDGACNGGALQPADAWLSELRQRDRFRFVPLMRRGRTRIDPSLAELARRTGWTEDGMVDFDARALLRAFAAVLSFSRGLRFDEGGRVGLERTFAGARTVRVLAIRDQGDGPLALERVDRASRRAIVGGPTFRHPTHGWSLRFTAEDPAEIPYAVRSPTAGAEVMVIPVYGQLRVEAVVAPCGEPPALPWNHERTVRAGQPACAWARLVGEAMTTIEPDRSFAFEMQFCEQPDCASASPMQSGEDGTFHAQLGAEVPLGRHERTFRARGSGMAAPIVVTRGFSAVSFGIHRVATAAAPSVPIQEIALGVLPKPTADDVQLIVNGAFPAGSHASVTCAVEGDPTLAECVVCELPYAQLELTDPFNVQARVRGTAYCPAVSEHGRDVPVEIRLTIQPDGEVPPRSIPLRATLHYPHPSTVSVSVMGGGVSEASVEVPGPIAATEVTVAVHLEVEDLEVAATQTTSRLQADDADAASISLRATAEDCCGVDTYRGELELTAASGGPSQRVPLEVSLVDPGWWTCPGKQIATWSAIALALLLLVWMVHGFLSPAKFREGAILAWAETHEGLLRLRDGDEGYRKVIRFTEASRGFRRAAAVHLGGPRAPLPSLKRLPDDGLIRASGGGGATLVVRGPGVERFEESKGWVELPVGEYPLSNRVTLRRGEEIYLQLRR